MMMKITGLTRSLLSLAKASEEDQKEPREGLPDQGTSGRIRDHQRGSSMRMNCFKDSPGISGKAARWKIKKFSLRSLGRKDQVSRREGSVSVGLLEGPLVVSGFC